MPDRSPISSDSRAGARCPSRRIPAPGRRARSVVVALLVAVPILATVTACSDREAPPNAGDSAEPADSRPLQMSREFWPNGNLKFEYEMRPSLVDGKWKRNGLSRAFYDNGAVERSGRYLDNERVGTWTYYAPDGTVARTEERGGGARTR